MVPGGKTMTDLGSRIKENRLKLGLTQKGLADKLFVTPQAVSRWEKDGIEPPLESLRKMSSIFHISLDELIGNDQFEEKQETTEESSQKEIPLSEENQEEELPPLVIPPKSYKHTSTPKIQEAKSPKVQETVSNSPDKKEDSLPPLVINNQNKKDAKNAQNIKYRPKDVYRIGEENSSNEVETTIVERGNYGICDRCHHLLKGPDDIHDICLKKATRRRSAVNQRICSKCYDKYLKEEKTRKENEKRLIVEKASNRRTRAFILGPLCAIAVALILCWIVFANTQNQLYTILTAVIGSIYLFPFFGCIFLNNNSVMYILGSIFSAFAIKWPGIIFSLSWDGIKTLIALKIIMALIGFAVGFIGFMIGVAISSIVALFVFIPSIQKSINNPEIIFFDTTFSK